MQKHASDLLVETLEQAGVNRIYGITGDSANFITDSISRSSIRLIHTRHEEVAAIAAGAEAAATGRLAVCMGSCGPGSLHLVNGLYDAHRNGSPVLALVTEIHQSQIGTRFVQEIDTRNLFLGCSHYCQYAQDAAQLPRIVGIAMQHAISKGGVAVVIIPGEVSSTMIDASAKVDYLPFYTNSSITPSDQEIEALAKLLSDSKRVTIYGGAGCIGAEKLVMELASKLCAPVAWTYRAKEALDHSNPYPVGMAGLLGTSAGAYALNNCDTLLLLGCGFAFTSVYPNNVKIIQIDIRGENLSLRHNISMGLEGDIISTLTKIMPHIGQNDDDSFAKECVVRYTKAQSHLQNLAKQKPTSKRPIYPEHLMRLLNDRIASDAWVTSDMGSTWAFMGRYIDSHGGRCFYTSSLHATMATAMPSSIGLALSQGDRQVVALCGDGGLSMSLGDLRTIVQEKIKPKLFVFNNSSLDFVSMEMKADGLLDSYTSLGYTDYAAIAAAMGIYSIRVDSVAKLESAIDEALDYNGAVLVDVAVDRLSMLMPPTVTSSMVESYSHYVGKMVLQGDTEELLEEALVNLRAEL